MSYVAWSVVFGEQPSAAKWNILGANDASFNNGTGIGTGAIGSTQLASASVTATKLATGAAHSFVVTTETTASTSYVALTTAQAVTVTIGANGLALVMVGAHSFSSTVGASIMGYAVSGANTIAADDNHALLNNPGSTAAFNATHTDLLTGLSAGSTTFTAQFRTSTGTSSFLRREIAVIPL